MSTAKKGVGIENWANSYFQFLCTFSHRDIPNFQPIGTVNGCVEHNVAIAPSTLHLSNQERRRARDNFIRFEPNLDDDANQAFPSSTHFKREKALSGLSCLATNIARVVKATNTSELS